MFFTAIRILILLLSFLGYCTALRKKDIPMPFVPILVMTGVGSLLFLAGILNMLPHTVALLLLGGLLCAFREKIWHSFGSLSDYDRICFAIFADISLFFAWRLQGTVPLHVDNFSHWILVIRDVLANNRFPNFLSELVDFQSYPIGAAGFAYLICTITGLQSDAVILFSQALIIAAALFTMLAFVKQFRLSSLMVFFLGCVFCLVVNPVADEALLKMIPGFVQISICEMLPDTLLSMLCIASTAIVIYYRKTPAKGAWLSLPVQIYLISVKNSGLFLILFSTALLLYWAYHSQQETKLARHLSAAKLSVIHSGIPLFIFLFWNRHVDLVFASGTTSKHAVSLYIYRGMLGGKGISGILEILAVFLKRFFSWSDSWFLLIVCIFLFGGIYFLQRKHSKQAAKNILLVFFGVVAAYVVFMMAMAMMYLVSMDYEEAIRLACYDRYEKTITAYLVGTIVIFLLHTLSSQSTQGNDKAVSLIATLSIFLILLPLAPRIPDLFVKRNPYEGSIRQFMEQSRNAYEIPDGSRALICLDADSEIDLGCSSYVARHVFWSNSAHICYASEFSLQWLETAVQAYDYLIVQTHTPVIQQFLQQNGYTPGKTVYLLNSSAQEYHSK